MMIGTASIFIICMFGKFLILSLLVLFFQLFSDISVNMIQFRKSTWFLLILLVPLKAYAIGGGGGGGGASAPFFSHPILSAIFIACIGAWFIRRKS